MADKLLILVNDTAMDTYKGRLENLKRSYSKWGFNLDETFNTMAFRGELDVLKNFTELHMNHFDENQILARGFLFMIRDSLDHTVIDKISKFPIFGYRYWQIYDLPAHLLLIHRGSQLLDNDRIIRKHGAIRLFRSSYRLPISKLELFKGLQWRYKFSVFKCYLIGGTFSIDMWKRSFYVVH